ncbi:MAG: hypothetical protein KDA84_20345, partial [Planctomycetaceae bacterium]|nr:hypothetical protein [Planctomycetaceae bacterium]
MTRFLGLDIGGANLKISDGETRAKSLPFALWKYPENLSATLKALIAEFPAPDGFAVTMTGELADCFATKAEGVDFILSAMEEAVGDRPVVVWQTGAEFISPEIAREIPLLVAAANWHALATFVGRMVPEGFSLMIDIGSTTTDIIPLLNGVPIPTGLTDRERLLSGELVYTGIQRTPLCAVSHSVRFRGEDCLVAAELFATTWDVYLILDQLEEEPEKRETANGKPAIKRAAHDRMARMICCDASEVTWEEAVVMAEHFAAEQTRQILHSITQVLSQHSTPLTHILISGGGSFLAEAICRETASLETVPRTTLGTIFQSSITEAACAFAVARLASERV